MEKPPNCAGLSSPADCFQRNVQVLINGETLELPEQLALSDLVSHLSLTPERVAIELNQHVVRRTEWAQTVLSDGDRIEIVHFVGGGCRQ